jgi:hypothetical protein
MKSKAKKKPLSPRQRLAIDRRRAEREYHENLRRIDELLSDPRSVPPNYRTTTAGALSVILHGGHLFALACVKAFLARTWHTVPFDQGRAEVWRFIDEQNALFASRVEPDVVTRWNAPDYELVGADQPQVETAGVR